VIPLPGLDALGSGLVACWSAARSLPWLGWRKPTWLRGFTGFVLILGAIVAWYRHLVQVESPNDRRFLLALAPAIRYLQ
jgi:hypothetical protein